MREIIEEINKLNDRQLLLVAIIVSAIIKQRVEDNKENKK